MSSIRKLLGRIINQPFVTERSKNNLDVAAFHPGYFQTFGELHPDKTFYVIWVENGGSGFFSNVSNVLCHIKTAEQLGMIPVVDFENFKTLYNGQGPINNSHNAWEYYFI